jgi:predicted transcriptional regulator
MMTVRGATKRERDLAEMLSNLDAKCRNCAPLNPLVCVTRCNIWKMKNELRRLRETMDDPDFMKKLFNVLKNQTRLQVLKAITRERHSIGGIQQELKSTGYLHSQETIKDGYLQPLLEVGLAYEIQDRYFATVFGGKLNEVLKDFPEFVNVLPRHSECYEETLLNSLLPEPKTFEDVTTLIAPKIASRTLKRLKDMDLITTPEDREHVFFFKSRRDPAKETFSSTERKVYTSIPDEGISAKKLAEKTGISMRRIYKYLRGLRGKKLIFTRKNPKVYRLTDKGKRLALVLNELQNLVEEIWSSSEQICVEEIVKS